MARKEKPIVNNVLIEAVAAEGNSLAHIDGKVIFIPQCIPGDVVDVRVTRKKRGFMTGCVVRLVTPSPMRVTPFCPHFGICGGCDWQHLPYEKQLEVKQQQVVDQLTRIGHLNLPEISPILGSPKTQFYRNKLDFAFSDHRWVLTGENIEDIKDDDWNAVGFHISGFFDKILDIKECHLQREPSDSIRLFIKDYAIKNKIPFFNLREQTGLMRGLIIRCVSTNEVMVTVIFAYDDKKVIKALLNSLCEQFPQITSLNYIVNTKKNDSITDLEYVNFYGKDYVYEQMEDLKFKIGPKSFFQTNSEQVHRLYSVVRDFANLTGKETVYDLYTGTGTIAQFLSKKAKKVVGIEYVQEAIDDANVNAKINNISNCSFYAGDMKEVLNTQFIEENGSPDVIILDPPRAGIHPSVADVILKAMPPKIVYVSCNPASQARDLAILCTKYKITAVQPVDMFPHTRHVENVVSLQIISSNE
jgi:23S rRNA (uracil-5-)-methyltransferase RumA